MSFDVLAYQPRSCECPPFLFSTSLIGYIDCRVAQLGVIVWRGKTVLKLLEFRMYCSAYAIETLTMHISVSDLPSWSEATSPLYILPL
jgi:hypothetical protein